MMFLSFSHLQKSVHISSIIHLQVPLSLFNLHFIGFDTMTPPESFGQALRPSFEAGQAAIRTSKAFEGEAAAVEGWGDVYIYNIHVSTELLYLYNEDIYIYTHMCTCICIYVQMLIYIYTYLKIAGVKQYPCEGHGDDHSRKWWIPPTKTWNLSKER